MSDLTPIETTLVNTVVPSALRPYAKALVSAIPPIATAWAVLQSGHLGVISVLQFILAVITTAGIYALPLLKGKWESGAKTGLAIVSAVISAGLAAGIGDGGLTGWIGFGSAALAAVLVEVVDNVPNALPEIQAVAPVVQQVAGAIARVPLPTADEVKAEG